MFAFEWIAEQKIREAIEAGEFDNLPGKGKPVDLDDYWQQDPETRMAYIVLKNSGYLPPRLFLRKEIERLMNEVAATTDRFRLRSRKYRERIGQAWHDLAPCFVSEEVLLHRVRVVYVPPGFRPASLSYTRSLSRLRASQVDKQVAEFRRLLQSYNASLENSRDRVWALLAEVEERQAELEFEHIKNELRRDLHVRRHEERGYVDVEENRAAFDREFQKFEFRYDESFRTFHRG
jgi:hypothetical protein